MKRPQQHRPVWLNRLRERQRVREWWAARPGGVLYVSADDSCKYEGCYVTPSLPHALFYGYAPKVEVEPPQFPMLVYEDIWTRLWRARPWQ